MSWDFKNYILIKYDTQFQMFNQKKNKLYLDELRHVAKSNYIKKLIK